MKKETAELIMAKLKVSIQQMNESICIIQENCTAEEFNAFRRGVGYTLSEIQERILDPILSEHPDLVPGDVDYKPPQGPTLAQIGAKYRPAS